MDIAIIQFPGSNCERETALAVQRAGMRPQPYLWNDARALDGFAGYILVGGFSYEDRGRSGLIAAKDPVLKRLAIEAEKGKPVLGICNGAQILVESGLVPGVRAADGTYRVAAALTENKRMQNDQVLGTGFYNAWCHIKPKQSGTGVFNQGDAAPLQIPLAHAEGRFVLTSDVLSQLKQAGADLWQYCDAAGRVDAHFPVNPNGAVENLAAVSNAAGNVLAMMPHPERTPAGDAVFTSMRRYIESGQPVDYTTLTDDAALPQIQPRARQASETELLVAMVIHDNVAVSVQNALHQMGWPIGVKRYVHWKMSSDMSTADLQTALADSYELWNSSKEFLVEPAGLQHDLTYLVRLHEDVLAQHKLHNLHRQCGLTQITHLQHGIVWGFDIPDTVDQAAFAQMLQAETVLYNPIVADCYHFAG